MRAQLATIAVLLALAVSACTSSVTAKMPASTPQASGGDNGSGWASSGGELLKDSQNPWWVKSTAEVKYCIMIDQAGISAPVDHVRKAVEYAIKYWTGEFARSVPYLSAKPILESNGNEVTQAPDQASAMDSLFQELGVGTQTFTEVPCGTGEDLAFQFGLGTLTPVQLANIPNPRTYVGVAERTDYDPVNLRGRGFIFIASDQGPGSYEIDEETQANAWSNDVALYTIVMHELGHVFGIPHCGAQLGLMSQQLPEALVSAYLRPFETAQASELTDNDAYGSFFFPSLENHMCVVSTINGTDSTDFPWIKFFNMKPSENCVWFTFDPKTSSLAVQTSDSFGSPRRDVGKVTGADYTIENTDVTITLRMNDQQTVFPKNLEINLGPSSLPYLIGPFRMSIDGIGGTYLADDAPAGAAPIPVVIRLSPDGFTMFSTSGGATNEVISWQNSM